MDAEVIVQILLRLLPSIVVTALAFIAASDMKTRERWTDLLYQAGSLKPEQRKDPRVQSGVRVPFFVVAAVLLIWPIQYYRHASRTIEANFGSLSRTTTPPPQAPVANTVQPGMAPVAPGNPAVGTVPVAPAPVAPPVAAQPGGRTNIYGTPLPPLPTPASELPSSAVPQQPMAAPAAPIAPPPVAPPVR